MGGCDGCTLCCKVLKIRELAKPGNVWCAHCRIGQGCSAYDTRPESCRVYECIWLQSQTSAKPLAPALRPDKSRVILGAANEGEDVVFYVGPDRPDAWKHGEAAKLLGELKAKGVTVLVSCGDRVERA